MTALSPLLTLDRNIGMAFAEAVAYVLTGQYHRLGPNRSHPTKVPAVFHCPFLMDMIPRLLSLATDFTSAQGSGVFYVRDMARIWLESRWWHPHPQGAYAAYLSDLVARLDHEDARYLALLADNYAPRDRDAYAVIRMLQLDHQSLYLPDIPLPTTPIREYPAELALIMRRSFLDGYPLMIGEDIYLPNRRCGHYDPVRLRTLSRGYLSHPALILRNGDAFLSTLMHIRKDQRKL